MNAENWYEVADAGKIDSPALLFYEDRIVENISRLKKSITDTSRLRPHVKTHKCREVTLLMLEAGITRFKCATIAEAEMLGMCKVPDILLAYQPLGPKIDRLIGLIRRYPDSGFSCLVDNDVSLQAIATAALNAETTIGLFLDLNVGMNRTGIRPGEAALTLYGQLCEQPGIRALGFHAYDGHVHDSSPELRQGKVAQILESLYLLRDQVCLKGLITPIIVAGGTPTYPFYAMENELECSPGTFALWDKGYQDAFREQDYLTAALVLTRVISLTEQNKITVDLGHKAVAAENELQRRVFFLNAPDLRVLAQSEEHLVLEAPEGHSFRIGDVLYGLPVHICPTVALYETAMNVVHGQLKNEWKIISRDRKINI